MEKEPSIETVVAHIKEVYQKQASALDSSLRSLEEKLRAYRAATKHDLLADFLERNGLTAGERQAEAAALALYEAIGELPEFRPVGEQVTEIPETVDDAPEAEETPATFPILCELTLQQPLLIFGGYVNEEKRTWLASMGVQNEWVSNEGGTRASGLAQRVATRVRQGDFCAIIMLNELMGHSESTALLAACRISNTPFAMGKKGGKGQLKGLCEQFERILTMGPNGKGNK